MIGTASKARDQATRAGRKENDRMQHKPEPEHAGTYYAQGGQSEQELVRLTIQGRMMTEAMGGPLPEQADPQSLRRVLDIACGPGEWVMATAKTYPTMSLTGIDISESMIQYAREQARTQQLEDRVSFHVMDALLSLEFPSSFFDLVNLRCCVGFMRTRDWPKMISEMRRVTRPQGVLRIKAQSMIYNSPLRLSLGCKEMRYGKSHPRVLLLRSQRPAMAPRAQNSLGTTSTRGTYHFAILMAGLVSLAQELITLANNRLVLTIGVIPMKPSATSRSRCKRRLLRATVEG